MAKRILFFLDELYFPKEWGFCSSSVAGEFLKDLLLPLEKSFMFPVADESVALPNDFSTFIDEKKFGVYPLPFWSSLVGFVLSMLKIPQMLKFCRAIKCAVKDNDYFWIRQPSLPGLFLATLALRKGKFVFVHVAGDIRVAWKNPKYSWLHQIGGCFVASYINNALLKMSRKKECKFFCTGSELMALFTSDQNKVSPTFFIDSMIGFSSMEAHLPTTGKLKLLYVGRLEADKGIFVLLDAMKILLEKKVSVSLEIVGFGSAENRIKEFIEKNRLQASISFIGYWPNNRISEVYRRNDVFVCPSFNEGFPRVIIEAWSFGLAVISTKVGGIEGLAINNENIYFCEKGSVLSLVKAIQFFIDSPLELKLAMKRVQKTWHEISREHFSNVLEVEIDKIVASNPN